MDLLYLLLTSSYIIYNNIVTDQRGHACLIVILTSRQKWMEGRLYKVTKQIPKNDLRMELGGWVEVSLERKDNYPKIVIS